MQPSPEQFTHYVYEPSTEAWVLSEAPGGTRFSMRQATLGALSQVGSTVRSPATGRIVGNIASVRGATLEVGNQGSVFLNNRVPRSRLDESLSGLAQPRVVIEGDLAAFGDTAAEPINRTISLAGFAENVYVDDRVQRGKARYSRQLAPAIGEAPPKVLANGMRLATAEERLVRGVAGYLARNAPGFIERARLAGIDRGDGVLTTDGSEIVRLLAAELRLTPVITYVLAGVQ